MCCLKHAKSRFKQRVSKNTYRETRFKMPKRLDGLSASDLKGRFKVELKNSICFALIQLLGIGDSSTPNLFWLVFFAVIERFFFLISQNAFRMSGFQKTCFIKRVSKTRFKKRVSNNAFEKRVSKNPYAFQKTHFKKRVSKNFIQRTCFKIVSTIVFQKTRFKKRVKKRVSKTRFKKGVWINAVQATRFK